MGAQLHDAAILKYGDSFSNFLKKSFLFLKAHVLHKFYFYQTWLTESILLLNFNLIAL